jgi:hypothetical protein
MYVPFVTVSDKDFALSENVLRPHPQRNASIDKQTHIQLQVNKSRDNGGMRVWHTL